MPPLVLDDYALRVLGGATVSAAWSLRRHGLSCSEAYRKPTYQSFWAFHCVQSLPWACERDKLREESRHVFEAEKILQSRSLSW